MAAYNPNGTGADMMSYYNSLAPDAQHAMLASSSRNQGFQNAFIGANGLDAYNKGINAEVPNGRLGHATFDWNTGGGSYLDHDNNSVMFGGQQQPSWMTPSTSGYQGGDAAGGPAGVNFNQGFGKGTINGMWGTPGVDPGPDNRGPMFDFGTGPSGGDAKTKPLALGDGAAPGGDPIGGAPMMRADAGGGAMGTGATGTLGDLASGQYNFGPMTGSNMAQYMDPSMAFRLQQGSNALQTSAANQGGLMSGANQRALVDYGQSVGSQEYGNAFNRALQDRGFGYNMANNDRNFDYNAQTGDRAFNQQNNQFLAGMGMDATRGQSSLAQTLASLLSQNAMNTGQVNGAATTGQANNIASMITQWLQANQGNTALDRIYGAGGR